ncbi:vesicle transport V-SNARE protein, partial [Seiridium cupressi]
MKKELASVTASGNPTTPAALGSRSASLTAFSRTLDEDNQLANQELVIATQEKAHERIKNFRHELSEF